MIGSGGMGGMALGAVTGMTGGGWGFLILAWGGIIAATFFCFYRLFQSEDKKR